MNEQEFWQLIADNVDSGDDEEVDVEPLQVALSKCTPEEILSFGEILDRLMRSSYSWRLWGAAYIINGGCSDDGFDYFRAWLIAKGQQVYEDALRDPETLAEVATDEAECENLLYVPMNAYSEATDGKELPSEPAELPELREDFDFDDEDEMRSRYPELTEKFS